MNHIINHSPKGYQKIQKIKDELLPLQNFPSSLLFSTLYLLGILLLSLCIHLFFGLADVSQSFEKVYSAMKRFRGEFLKRSERRYGKHHHQQHHPFLLWDTYTNKDTGFWSNIFYFAFQRLLLGMSIEDERRWQESNVLPVSRLKDRFWLSDSL